MIHIVTLRLMCLVFLRLISWIALFARSEVAQDAEILVLRHQLAVLLRQVARPRPTWADRAGISAFARLLATAGRRHLFVTPGALLRWHADLVGRRWTFPQHQAGRSSTWFSIRAVILRMAKENPAWGYRRIADELAGTGCRVGTSTAWTILKRTGINPARRRSGPSWAQFLRSQAAGILACDFFEWAADEPTR
jgi:hypothetical protein